MSDDLAKKLLRAIEKNNELNEALLREFRGVSAARADVKEDDILNYTEVARKLGRTRQTVSQYVAQGRLTVVERGGVRGILSSELKKFKARS